MSNVVKLYISFYVFGALFLMALVLYRSGEYCESILGRNVDKKIHTQKIVYHSNGFERYKYFLTLSESLLGLYNVETSITDGSGVGVANSMSTLYFGDEDLLSLTINNHHRHTLDEPDFFEGHVSNHKHNDIVQIIYNNNGVNCNVRLNTGAVMCFKY